jgi:hypothetical protein
MPREEIVQQDANIEETSAPQESSGTEQQQAISAQSEISEQESTPEPNVPFHEHPRFRELIEERRQAAEELQAMREQLAELQSLREQSQPPSQKPKNPFAEKLREINPEYAAWVDKQTAIAEEVEQLKAEREADRKRQVLENYNSSVEKLHTEFNVPKEWQGALKRQLDYLAMTDKRVGLGNLKEHYKTLHDEFKSLIDSTKREERKSYVTEKSKDAKIPSSQPKGAAPSRDEKGRFAGMDREQIKSEMTRQVLKIAKAEKDF